MPTPSRTDNSPTEMDFGAALRLVAIGKKITRREWANDDCVFLHASFLHLRKTDGSLHQIAVSEGDIVATDWVVVREQ